MVAVLEHNIFGGWTGRRGASKNPTNFQYRCWRTSPFAVLQVGQDVPWRREETLAQTVQGQRLRNSVSLLTKHGVQKFTKDNGVFMVGGRLASFVDAWKVLTEDLWVLNTIAGYQISFKEVPMQAQRPPEARFSKEQEVLLRAEIDTLLQKGATLPQVHNPEGFYSTLFLVPKKNGQMRPVINLKQLNQWMDTPHFKMEGISTLRDLLRAGDWMVKVDLKDQQYLRFTADSKCYQFPCLPFSLSCAPWTFTKVMKPLMALLRAWGIRIIIYIDDMLILVESREAAMQHLEVLIFLLEALGQQGEIHSVPSSGTGVPRIVGRLIKPPAQITQQEVEADPQGGGSTSTEGVFVSTTTLPVSGEAECSFTSNTGSSSILQDPTKGSAKSSAPGRLGLRSSVQTFQRSPRGAVLVAGSPVSVEWQDSDSETDSISDTVRCLTVRLGGSMQQCEYRRLMKPPREVVAHKLPGASGSRIGTEYLRQITSQHISTSTAGQLYCSSIHQQTGRTCVTGPDSPGKIHVVVGSGEGHNDHSSAHIPGVSNMVADSESRLEQDRFDWMLSRSVFLKINQVLGPLEMDLFASRLTHQLPRFFS